MSQNTRRDERVQVLPYAGWRSFSRPPLDEPSARSLYGVIRRLWGDAEHLDTGRRLEAVPGASRHDDEIAGPEASGSLGTLAKEEDVRLSVDDHHNFVGGAVALPLTVAGPMPDEHTTVPIRRHHGETIGGLLVCGVGRPISEEPQARESGRCRDRLWARWVHRVTVPAMGTEAVRPRTPAVSVVMRGDDRDHR